MKKNTLLIINLLLLTFMSCTETEQIQEVENKPITTRNVEFCIPSLSSTSINLTEGSSYYTEVDWAICQKHQHTYTLKVSGGFTGTYTTSQPPIYIPYMLHSGESLRLTLSTTGNNGMESITKQFTKNNNTIEQGKLCKLTMPRIHAAYSFYPNNNSSIGLFSLNLHADTFTGHQGFHVRLFKALNGVPLNEIYTAILTPSDSYIVGSLQMETYNYIGNEYKIIVQAFDGCSPIANTNHYMYGDINFPSTGTSNTSIEFYEVINDNDANTW